MTRFSPALVAALLIGFSGCDNFESAPATTADASPIVHQVSVGGSDIDSDGDGRPDDANFSASIREFADGTVRGNHIDVVTPDNPGEGNFIIRGRADCLRVVGNTAYWSGTVDGGPYEGRRFLSAAKDLGRSQRDPADQISFTYLLAATSTTTCESNVNLQFFDQIHGQVTIR